MTRKWLLGSIVIVSVVVLGCVCDPCDEGKKNKELVAEVFAVIEAGDFDKLDQFIAADYVRHCQATPDIHVTSLEGLKEFLQGDLETVSDPKMVLHRLVAEDDLVAFWATYSGIQDGPMGPFPATGKRMELDFAGMHRIADDKIVETWVTWDNLTGLAQLGHFPPQPPEGTE
ncbi:MAG: ester cyclase [Thermoanaerobaculales bacterium]|nr:ester cyclase [Thermoanaerobaculales bacterium]